MKKVLSLVLALVLILGTIPAFAAEKTGAENLFDAEFISGGVGGDLMVNDELTREQLAVLILQVNGKFNDAEGFAMPANYADASEISAWAVPFVAYAQANNLMLGKSNNMFDPMGPVSAAELVAVMMNALGYPVTWATVIADGADLGITATGSALTRGEAFETMWFAVSEVLVNGEEFTLGVQLGKLTPAAPVVTDVMITSVAATNLKEIVVTFNQVVDKATVLAANFSLSPAAGTLTPVLGDDGMTVTITTGTAMTNQGAYKLTAEKVANAAEMKLAKVVTTFSAFDATLPTVESIVVTGPKTFDIMFSEPMETSGTVTVKSASTTLAVASAPATGTNKVTVTLYTALVDATSYDITIKDFEDFAGYKNVVKTIAQAYAKDITAPVVSLVSANQQYAVVEFNKPVTGLTKANFYHTFSAWVPIEIYKTKADMDADTNPIIASTTNVTKVYVQFATDGAVGEFPLQPGTVNIHVLGKVGTVEVKDNWSNALATTVLTANVVADLTAPTVTKVEATDNNELTITFSKDVAPGTVSNYEILDNAGKAISGLTISPATGAEDNEVVLSLTSTNSLVGETVIVNIKNIVDTTLNQNKLAATYTTNITFEDLDAPTVVRVEFDATNKLLYVTYSEAMGATATAIANYKLLDGTTVRSLTGPATFFAGNKVVKIELTTTQAGYVTAGTDKLLISNLVADIAGNTPSAFQLVEPIVNLGVGAAVPSVVASKIRAIDENTITVQFDQEIVALDPTNFDLTLNGTTWAKPTSMAFSLNDDGTVVTLTFAGTIPANVPSTVKLKATFTTGSAVNVFGISANNLTATSVVDKIAPEVLTAVVTSSTLITVTFTEALEADNFAAAATKNGFTVAGGTATITGANIASIGNDGAVVLITGTNFVAETTTVTYVKGFIKDIIGNYVDSFTNVDTE